jgi:hypothetical protein
MCRLRIGTFSPESALRSNLRVVLNKDGDSVLLVTVFVEDYALAVPV